MSHFHRLLLTLVVAFAPLASACEILDNSCPDGYWRPRAMEDCVPLPSTDDAGRDSGPVISDAGSDAGPADAGADAAAGDGAIADGAVMDAAAPDSGASDAALDGAVSGGG